LSRSRHLEHLALGASSLEVVRLVMLPAKALDILARVGSNPTPPEEQGSLRHGVGDPKVEACVARADRIQSRSRFERSSWEQRGRARSTFERLRRRGWSKAPVACRFGSPVVMGQQFAGRAVALRTPPPICTSAIYAAM